MPATEWTRTDVGRSLAVSVVVAVYNGEGELEPLLGSLAGQTLPAEAFEIIFVDDGSTDATLERLRRFESEHPNVTVVHHSPNSGWPGRPRNIGMDRARGEYLFFVDHDDRLALDALATMYRFAREHDTDVLLGKEVGIGIIVPWSTFRRTRPRVSLADEEIVRILTPHKMFRRSLLERHGIRFPDGDVRLEDNQFVMRAYFAADVISIYADTPCYFWARRRSRNNIAHRFVDPRKYHNDVDAVLQVVEDHTEPGELRNGLYVQWYRRKLLRAFMLESFYRATAETQQVYVDVIREIVERRIAPEVDTLLSHADRVRAHLVRAGDVAGLVQLAVNDTGMTATLTPAQVRWDGDALAVTARATLAYADGAPVHFRRVGERIERLRPELTGDRLPAHVRDVSPWANEVYGTFLLRDRGTHELAEIATERESGFVGHGEHLVLRLTARARIDVHTGFNGRSLPEIVDVLLRFGALGWNGERRVPMDVSAPDGLIHDAGTGRFLAYGTEGYGKLSIRRSRAPQPPPQPPAPPPPPLAPPVCAPLARLARGVARRLIRIARRRKA